ncbi:MAG: GGDEF domain-containing protein [Proteobacteria bacterium]|nr:GGDEF domain-containing protein [Pseudomonadota bacterium]MBU1610499.1 GGDEF domain-containing protein [Pseudomonadota bacterium]
MARRFLTKYILVLTLLTACTTGGYIMVQHLITIQEDNSSLVTMSGNQLMLSQRILTTAVSFMLAGDEATRAASAQLLEDSIETMTNAHGLLTGDIGPIAKIFAESEILNAIYYAPPYQLDQQVKRFLQRARELLLVRTNYERQAAIDTILSLSSGNLAEGLSVAVKQYQFEVVSRIKSLEHLRLAMLAAIYLLLALDGLIIVRPLLSLLGKGERELVALKEKMEAQATLDSLTRVQNRRAFKAVLDRERANQERYGGDLSLLLIDVDNFRDLNAAYGQETGDRLLQEVAQLVQNNVRQTDYVFRSGGAEFAVLAVSTPLEGALLLATKLSGLARANSFHNRIRLGVRVGVARMLEDETADQFTTRTTAALELARATANGVAEAPTNILKLD